MLALPALLAAAEDLPPPNVLEWTYLGVLVVMTVATAWFGLFVVARIVEPRGVKALLRRLAGKA